MKTKIWVSALIPAYGADIYDGVRLLVSLTEADCYRDLAEWLEIPYRGPKATTKALDRAMDPKTAKPGFGIHLWRVEEQVVYS